MSIAEYKPRAEYIGADNLAEYSFDFKITSVDQIITRITDAAFGLICEVRGVDSVFVQGITYDSVLGKGVVTLVANLATNYNLTILLAPDAPIQTTEFRNKSDFTLRRLEQALDVQMSAIQRLSYSVQRAIKLSDNFKMDDVFDNSLPINSTDTLIQDNRNRVLQMNSTNDGLEFGLTQAQQVASLADLIEDTVIDLLTEFGGVSPDTKSHSLLETVEDPLNPGDYKTEWTGALSYTGYSLTFESLIDLKGIKAIMDFIINMGYTPPNLGLGGSVSNALREIGNTISSVTLTGTFTKTLDDLSELRFFLNPSTLLDTQSIGPGSGSGNFTYSTPFSTTTTFRAEVDDVSVEGKPSKTATLTYPFVYPYYYGAGTAGKTGAQIRSDLNMDIINNTNNYSKTLVSAGSQKLYIAYPASHGALTSILDANLFEVISTFTATTLNITGLDGNPVSYRVYESNNLVIAGSFAFQFKK